ncbi:MAG: Gfo/Idh/MocA family oxidoreductase, partial [Bacteroidota bacterium]
QLTIGYRMQHEPNTQQIMRWAKELPLGKIKHISAAAGYRDNRTDHWKMNKKLGGGAMYDMGVYPLNGIRYSAGSEPVMVTQAKQSTTRPEIFSEVDETTEFTLEFANGIIANGMTSLGQGVNNLQVDTAKGSYGLEPFSSYSGIKGSASNGTKFDAVIPNQQARQMDDDALAIKNGTAPMVPGEEGWRDIRIVEAIYKAAATGQSVALD